MRLIQRAERSFVASIVEKTRKLLGSSGPTALKVAVLEHWAKRQTSRAEKIEARAAAAAPERSRRLAGIRRRAAGYLHATAKYLLHRQEHPMSLRERPRFLVDPSWDEHAPLSDKEETPKFMEFSS